MRLIDQCRRLLRSDDSAGLQALIAEVAKLRSELEFIKTRLSCYVGDGVALTYLSDETPIFVNANDVGCPFNLMNGGRYEEENTSVLLSFVKSDTVFLDIGANVGFYTLKIARRLVGDGKVYAFEPHPKLYELLHRNAYVNGFSGTVRSFQLALSDRNGTETLQFPVGHLGGGRIAEPGGLAGFTAVDAETRGLDDLLGPDFRCDLVKIDVEGHELGVLEGMRRIVQGSPDIKILFEKLLLNAGHEDAIEAYFAELGCDLYAVQLDASLSRLESGGLAGWAGYVVAAKPGAIRDGLKRSRFSVFGDQLWTESGPPTARGNLLKTGSKGQMLFHGPYWFLPRGVWNLKVHGEFSGTLRIALLERFGHPVVEFRLEPGQSEYSFIAPHDLVNFECAVYAAAPSVTVNIERLEFYF